MGIVLPDWNADSICEWPGDEITLETSRRWFSLAVTSHAKEKTAVSLHQLPHPVW